MRNANTYKGHIVLLHGDPKFSTKIGYLAIASDIPECNVVPEKSFGKHYEHSTATNSRKCVLNGIAFSAVKPLIALNDKVAVKP